MSTTATAQVLRDEIGTAVRQINSRADHFSLIMHGQEGEGETKEAFLGKEGAQVCGTQKMCPRRKSLTLGFLLPQSCRKVIMHSQEGEGEPQEASPQKESALL